MNPLKLFKDSVPQLATVLESIHAHLELILESQNKSLEIQEAQLEILQKINEKTANSKQQDQDKDETTRID